MSGSICMIKKCISVTSHALDPLPLSQTVTPSRTPSPSSVTYFMDSPLHLVPRESIIYVTRKVNNLRPTIIFNPTTCHMSHKLLKVVGTTSIDYECYL